MILDNTTHVVHVLWLLMHDIVELTCLFGCAVIIGGLSTNRFCLVFSLIWTG